MSWEMVAIRDIAEVISGATPKSSVSDYWGGDVLWATPTDLSKNEGAYLSQTSRRITRAGLSSCAAQILPPNSVLMSSRAPIGLVAINTEPMATNQGFKSLIPDQSRVFEGYLYHWLATNTAYLQSLGNGATFKEVSKSVVQRIEIPLPPLEEQRRIAGILDAADALRRRRREAIALLDTLPGAIFAEMFGKLTSSNRFPRDQLSKLITGFETGKNLAPATAEEGSRYRVLKVSSVTKGEFLEAESKPLPADYLPPSSHFVKQGDLLFSRANTSALIGATALVETVSDNIVLPDKIWRFCFDQRTADPIFVHYLFGTREFRDELSRRATGSSGSMKNISKGKVLSIEVGQPSLEDQQEFSRRVRAARELRSQLSDHLSHLESLFASLQSRAFAGDL